MASGVLSFKPNVSRAAAIPSTITSSRIVPTYSGSEHHISNSRRTLRLRGVPSPLTSIRLRQQRSAARSVTTSAAAAAAAAPLELKPPPRFPWTQIRRLAVTAGCCIAWLWIASSFQASSSPFAAMTFSFRSAAQTGTHNHSISRHTLINMIIQCSPSWKCWIQ